MNKQLYEDTYKELMSSHDDIIYTVENPSEIILILKLKSVRIAKGLSQSEVAESIGGHQSNISRFENPEYEGRTINSIRTYANGIGCRVDFDIVVEE